LAKNIITLAGTKSAMRQKSHQIKYRYVNYCQNTTLRKK